MGKRRLAHVASSSDDEPDNPTSSTVGSAKPPSSSTVEKAKARVEEQGEEEKEKEKEKDRDKEEEGEEEGPDMRPLGDVIKKSGRGRSEKKHYAAFELDGNRYQLEDPVLVTPEEKNEKPYVAIIKVEDNIVWPEAAVVAISALERAAYESLGSDNHKYNLKMRQLEFNLKNNAILAKRLLKKELEASIVLNMSPTELKDGLTAEEKTAQEPQELQTMQMTDVRCSICMEKKVGVRDIIHVGYGDRYQLECLKCGNLWYASRDSISSLTIEPVNPVSPAGTAPLATTKFDEIEKTTGNSRESEQPANGEIGKKEIPAEIPVIDRQSAGSDVASAPPDSSPSGTKHNPY